MISFGKYMAAREGLLPQKPPAKGLPKINTTPLTQQQRRTLNPTVRPAPQAPPVRPVVPPKLVAKLTASDLASPAMTDFLRSWFLS